MYLQVGRRRPGWLGALSLHLCQHPQKQVGRIGFYTTACKCAFSAKVLLCWTEIIQLRQTRFASPLALARCSSVLHEEDSRIFV